MGRKKKICDICNKEISLSNFSRHYDSCSKEKIVSKLNVDWKQENGKYKCPHCNKEYSKYGISTHIWRNHTTEGKKQNPNKGFLDGTRIIWNKGLTKESDERIKKIGETYSNNIKNGITIPSFLGKHHTEEYKEKMRKRTNFGLVKRSRNEIYFAELCGQHFNTVLTNECIFNGWDADVIIEDIKMAILWNGKWHYEKIMKNHSVEQVQNRDMIKLNEIKKAGYKSYTIKDMGSYNKNFVEKEFNKFYNSIN